MAKYTIECEQCLGISHDGAVYTDGEGTVELSDEEVTTLVQLIRLKGTTDVAYSGDSRSPIPMISVHSFGDLLYRRQS